MKANSKRLHIMQHNLAHQMLQLLQTNLKLSHVRDRKTNRTRQLELHSIDKQVNFIDFESITKQCFHNHNPKTR